MSNTCSTCRWYVQWSTLPRKIGVCRLMYWERSNLVHVTNNCDDWEERK